MHHLTKKIAHTTAFVTSAVEHRLEKEIAQMVQNEGLIRDPSHHKLMSYHCPMRNISMCPPRGIDLMTCRSTTELHLTPDPGRS